ncbi:MAG: nuclear transport factor 2 family protein [Terriglobales bacterium]
MHCKLPGVSMTAEQVRDEVRRYWGAFSSKSAENVDGFYLPEAVVFGSSSARAEPGRLAATRRKREYFHSESHISVQLGAIEVQMLGEEAAVASYTFRFHASNVAGALGRTVEEKIEHGRVTQVFVSGGDGRLAIVNEHISVIA